MQRAIAAAGAAILVLALSACTEGSDGALGVMRLEDNSVVVLVEMCEGKVDELEINVAPYRSQREDYETTYLLPAPMASGSVGVPPLETIIADQFELDSISIYGFGEGHWAVSSPIRLDALATLAPGQVLFSGPVGRQVGSPEDFFQTACAAWR